MDPSERSKVFLIDASDRPKNIKRLFQEFDLATDGTVALKANYNSDDPFPATTHNETLRTLVELLKASGPDDIIMAERSGMGYTPRVLKNRGVIELSKEMGFKLVDLDALDLDGWEDIQADGLHWKHGFKIAKIFREADIVVQTCCLKTHRFGGHFTLSLKNSVGLVAAQPPGTSYDYMLELHTSPYQRLMIAEINKFYETDMVLMDASSGFVRGGPERGDPIEPGLLLASTDRVAVDATGVAMLRLNGTTPDVMRGRIFEQEQISRAASLGVGVASSEKIDLVPLDEHSQRAAEVIGNILGSQG
ncbi:MAG TPA: DUF362 domain-containing protein [Methanotrichaceae archaeon]|nr:DUF362 domain-containing protein [Methanotrichaceae archaeon]